MNKMIAAFLCLCLTMVSMAVPVYADYEENTTYDIFSSGEENTAFTDGWADSIGSAAGESPADREISPVQEDVFPDNENADSTILYTEEESGGFWKDEQEISEIGEIPEDVTEFGDDATSFFTSQEEDEPVFESGEEEPSVEEASEEELLTAEASLPDKKVTAPSGCSAAKLQSLLDLNKNGKFRLILTIPAGTYRLNRPLFVNSNTTIMASSKAKLIKQERYGAIIESRLRKSSNGTDGGYNSCRNITIEGGIWDTSPLLNSIYGTESFRFIHCTNVTIKNLTLCNVPRQSHLLVFAGVKNGVVSNCKFYGYGNGQNLNSNAKEAIQLDVVHSSKLVPNQQMDVITWDDLACDGITISGCEFHDFARGIGSHMAVAGHEHNNVVIQGNHFYNIYDNAIRLFNYKNTKVTDNLIEKSQEGIFLYTYFNTGTENYLSPNNGQKYPLPSSYNIEISSNTIRNISSELPSYGNGIRILGSKERPVRGITIAGNTIKSTKMYGVYALWAPRIAISNNRGISSSNTHGIFLNCCNKGKITKNSIFRAGESAITLYQSTGVSVNSNKISSASVHGIYGVQSPECIIGKSSATGNQITNTGKDAICLAAPNGTSKGCGKSLISYNTVTNAGRYGISAFHSAGINLNKNTVSAKGHGILLQNSGGKSKVTFNTVASGVSGIRIDKSSTASVASNTVKKASICGIYFSESSKSTIKCNVISSSGKHGIYLTKSSSSTVITKNTVKKFASKGNYNGIYISSSAKCTISSNQISYSGNKTPKGIYVSKSNQTTVKSNTVKGCSKKNALVFSGSSGCKKSGNKI